MSKKKFYTIVAPLGSYVDDELEYYGVDVCPQCGNRSHIIIGVCNSSYATICQKCKLSTDDHGSIEESVDEWNAYTIRKRTGAITTNENLEDQEIVILKCDEQKLPDAKIPESLRNKVLTTKDLRDFQ